MNNYRVTRNAIKSTKFKLSHELDCDTLSKTYLSLNKECFYKTNCRVKWNAIEPTNLQLSQVGKCDIL